MFQFFKKRVNQQLAAVVDGKCIPLESVNDPVFAEKTLGEGVAFIPEDELVVAPCEGVLSMIADTLHAFGIEREDGLQVMVHIGIDTVMMDGKGFEKLAEVGGKIKKGQPIIRFDRKIMDEKEKDMTTMLIMLNSSDYHIVALNYNCQMKRGIDTAIEYYR